MKAILLSLLIILYLLAGCKTKAPTPSERPKQDNIKLPAEEKKHVVSSKIAKEIEEQGGVQEFLRNRYAFDTIRAFIEEIEPKPKEKKGIFQKVFSGSKVKDKSRVTYNITIKDKSEVTVKDKSEDNSKDKSKEKVDTVEKIKTDNSVTTKTASNTWIWILIAAAVILIGGHFALKRFKIL